MSYLDKLKSMRGEQFVGHSPIKACAVADEDPILTPDEWIPEFSCFCAQVYRDTLTLDWGWVREDRPELFQAIRAKEDELDRLGNARLSQVMAIIQAWRELVLKAETEHRGANLEARSDRNQ